MNQELLRLGHISKNFSGVQALKDVSLTLHPGKTYGLVGENGSGKSTLIKVTAGILPPDSGEIFLHHRVFRHLHPIQAIREGIQVIYQDLALFHNLTVAENIALNCQISLKRRWVRWQEVRKIAAGALRRMGVDLDLSARVGELPIAGRQLIAIARALLQNAQLIVMDEPTAALTQKEVKALFGVIHGLKRDGISVLFVSHKLDEVMEIAEQTIILRNGEKVQDRESVGLDRTSLVGAMTGRVIDPQLSSYPMLPRDTSILLKVHKLSCRPFFHDISFELRAGEILGVTGLLGSGQSSLALSLFGMIPAHSGTVTLEGRLCKLKGIQSAIESGIAYVPEDRLIEGLFLTRSIGENIVAGTIDSFVNRKRLLDHRAIQARIDEWVARLKIRTSSTNLPASSLSGGHQQRVVLARWLAGNPKVLILNGPTVGIDVSSKMEIHEMIRVLAERGTGIIVISDDIPELLAVCHRILLMKRGRIAEEFERQKITEARLSTMLVSA